MLFRQRFPGMNKADHYRDRATEATKLAIGTDDAEQKALLLLIAQEWLELAHFAEDKSALYANPGRFYTPQQRRH